MPADVVEIIVTNDVPNVGNVPAGINCAAVCVQQLYLIHIVILNHRIVQVGITNCLLGEIKDVVMGYGVSHTFHINTSGKEPIAAVETVVGHQVFRRGQGGSVAAV